MKGCFRSKLMRVDCNSSRELSGVSKRGEVVSCNLEEVDPKLDGPELEPGDEDRRGSVLGVVGGLVKEVKLGVRGSPQTLASDIYSPSSPRSESREIARR